MGIISCNLKKRYFSCRHYIPKKIDERENDVVTNFAYQDCDSILFKIPEGYKIEYLPENISIESDFGSYNMQIQENDGEILYIRNHTFYKGRFPKTEYTKFREYLIDIVNQDKKKIILSKEV